MGWIPVGGGAGVFTAIFSAPGVLGVASGLARFYPPVGLTLVSVRASLGSAPTGAGFIVDVNKNGTTIFTTQANRPVIADGSHVSSVETPDITVLDTTDYLTVDVDQVGSTVPGSYLSVIVECG